MIRKERNTTTEGMLKGEQQKGAWGQKTFEAVEPLVENIKNCIYKDKRSTSTESQESGNSSESQESGNSSELICSDTSSEMQLFFGSEEGETKYNTRCKVQIQFENFATISRTSQSAKGRQNPSRHQPFGGYQIYQNQNT
eukprot:UN05215